MFAVLSLNTFVNCLLIKSVDFKEEGRPTEGYRLLRRGRCNLKFQYFYTKWQILLERWRNITETMDFNVNQQELG